MLVASRTGSVACRATAMTVPAPAGSAARRKMQSALAHLAYSTPAQFSSFYGAKMFLPQIYVSRSRMTSGVLAKKPVQMSFLGVGAPEAILVGVVALVVFGPKGLADAAKSIGSTLRSFQPTIREVVEVTSDLKQTLDKELGLNEIREAARVTPIPRVPEATGAGLQATMAAVGSEEDPEIEAKRAASAAAAWGALSSTTTTTQSTPPMTPNVPQTLSGDAPPPSHTAAPAAASVPAALTDEQLEAELARRRAAKASQQGNGHA